MRSRFYRSFAGWLFALIVVAAASAQDVFVTPIPNAPFSGVIRVQRSVVQRDGSIVDFKTIRDIGRDSQGRIYNEYRELLPASPTKRLRSRMSFYMIR
jgi:hypothetical protein